MKNDVWSRDAPGWEGVCRPGARRVVSAGEEAGAGGGEVGGATAGEEIGLRLPPAHVGACVKGKSTGLVDIRVKCVVWEKEEFGAAPRFMP